MASSWHTAMQALQSEDQRRVARPSRLKSLYLKREGTCSKFPSCFSALAATAVKKGAVLPWPQHPQEKDTPRGAMLFGEALDDTHSCPNVRRMYLKDLNWHRLTFPERFTTQGTWFSASQTALYYASLTAAMRMLECAFSLSSLVIFAIFGAGVANCALDGDALANSSTSSRDTSLTSSDMAGVLTGLNPMCIYDESPATQEFWAVVSGGLATVYTSRTASHLRSSHLRPPTSVLTHLPPSLLSLLSPHSSLLFLLSPPSTLRSDGTRCGHR